MGRYVQLGAVRTWYEEDGGGPPLVLLHTEEPTLTVADLAGYPGPTLVMVGDDDDEIPMDHTLALRQGLPRSQLAVVPGWATACSSTSRALQPDRHRVPDRGRLTTRE